MHDTREAELRQGKNRAELIPIKTVLFDYGNVISLPQQDSDVEKMAAICELPVSRFQELYWRFRMPYDRGDLDGPAYWALLARDGGCRMSELQVSQLIEVDSQSWARLNDSTLKWVERMAASGIRLGLLSNMPLEISRYLKQNARWPEMFDSLVYSCDVREVKPDPAIYAYSLKALDSRPEDVLFVDDRTENLEAASQLGIHTLLFDTVEDASRRAGEQFALPPAGN